MAEADQIYFNPFDPEFRANPYPYYVPLLNRKPVQLGGDANGATLVARYDDVQTVLRNPVTFSSHQPENTAFKQINLTGGGQTMLGSDPPVHTRLRKLVSRDFTPRRVQAMEPRIRAITNELIGQMADQSEIEVMADLANQLPVRVIAEMLGVPPQRHREFKHWSDTIVASATVALTMPRPPEALAAVAELQQFFDQEIERHRSDPGPDLISALVASQDAEVLTEKELMGFLILLLMAGNETTTNLIGNGLLALGRYPEQLQRLRQQPNLIGGAVEEILRYDGPVQGTVRTATEAAEIGGTKISAGSTVLVLLAAADRDPSQFPDPDRFDIGRRPNDHVAFGQGIHFCLGATLARLEGTIAIESMVERFPNLHLADPQQPLRYKGSLILRGLAALPMAIQ